MTLCFDILDDLSDELSSEDHFRLLSINELTFELCYKVFRRIEYYFGVDIEMALLYPILIANDLDAVKWLYNNPKDYYRLPHKDFRYSLFWACNLNKLDIAMWIFDNVPEVSDDDYGLLKKHTVWDNETSRWFDEKLKNTQKGQQISVRFHSCHGGANF